MKFVFFDIECACVYKSTAKICAFGYVVCDEQFNIIEKEDILINPRGKFHLTDKGKSKGLVLPYEYESFSEYPTFDKVYSRIRRLLEDSDALIFGHSTMNDVNYLNLETIRYRLPPFNFKFVDTQVFYMEKTKTYSHQCGIETITADMQIDFTPHKAVDDAYATLKIAQKLCENDGCTMLEFIERYKIIYGVFTRREITSCMSQGYVDFVEEKNRIRRERELKREHLSRFVSRRKPLSTGKLLGKVYCFSKTVEDDLELCKRYVRQIYALGGQYCFKLDKCNAYVICPGEDGLRVEIAKRYQSEGKLEVVELDTLYGVLFGE